MTIVLISEKSKPDVLNGNMKDLKDPLTVLKQTHLNIQYNPSIKIDDGLKLIRIGLTEGNS